jgi:ATP-dependent exoDNAse (exonuclease V) beta subunit
MEKPILKLEASAGSGKTYRLALEYLGRLMLTFAGQGNKKTDRKKQRELLGSVLAITFTVKAAQVMKERIVNNLKSFALGGGKPLKGKDDEFLSQLAARTGLKPEKIIRLSVDLIELILANYDDFNVTTIDSLMSAMVKAVSPDLDLPADYEIAVDAGDEMTSRGRAMLAALADNDWERLEHFLADLRGMSHKVAWKADEAIVEKVTALFRRTLQQVNDGADPAAGDLRQRLDSCWLNFKSALRPLSRLLDEEPLKNGKCEHVSGTGATGRLLKALAAALQGGGGFPGLETLIGSSFFCRTDPEALLVKKAPPDYRHRFIAAYRPAQQALREIALAFSAFKTLPYREFLGNFTSRWENGKKTLFVEEFSQTLARLFARWSEEAFPYLYLKMSDRFRNFLFDEFQDTSNLQFKALAPLIDEVLSREKNASLFIVGDRKQAIYRWRGGNSELMEESLLREQVPAIDNLCRETFSATLGANWRSRRQIVDFNNRFWEPAAISRIAASGKLQQAIGNNFQDSRQALPADKERQGGYVELALQVEAQQPGEEGEAATEEEEGSSMGGRQLGEVKAIIDRLRGHGYEYRHIAVLVRKNAQVRDIVRRLGREGIPTISDQSLMLDSNSRVGEIIAFLRFLDYPPDSLNFHAFVSGDIFRKQAKDKFPGEMAAFSEDVFIGCQGPFYKLFQEKFPGTWKGLIEPLFQSVGFLPPYDLFSDITQVFSIYDNFSNDTPFFMALGDALHRAEREGGSSIAGFLRLWKNMAANEQMPAVTIPENTPGVRVLTMHQSKGLEFPAVIVPVNDSGGRGDDSLHWDREGLFYINADLALAHPDLRERYENENNRCSIDLLNLLYVAFTRAEDALFVPVAVARGIKPVEMTAPARGGEGLVKKISRASDVVGHHPLLNWCQEGPPGAYRSGKLETRKERQGEKEGNDSIDQQPAAIRSKKMLTRSWQSRYLVFKKADAKQRRDRQGAKRGERVHDLLSRLGKVSAPGQLAARVRELAAQAGWPGNAAETVVAYLCRDDVFSVLSRGQEVHREKEVVDNSGALPEFRRLDRLQVDTDEVLVIDFKTGPEKRKEYETQMAGYVGAVTPLYPGRQCRGFLLYIDRGELEEVPCSN